MNKLIRLSPTGIEYGDYAWNFASGCGNQVDGKCKAGGFKCWAYSISQRFENHYPNGFKPTIYPEALLSPIYLKKPSRILCAFMGDLFWDCPEFNPDRDIHSIMPSGRASITMSLKGWIFTTIKECPQHTFLFLTKQPQNLLKFSPFPDNCWVGVTATRASMMRDAIVHLKAIKAKVKYISLEPYLHHISPHWLDVYLKDAGVNWIIIGSLTCSGGELAKVASLYPHLTAMPYGNRYTLQPKIEWVKEIVEAADKAGIPVFLKNNLKPLFKDKEEPYWFVGWDTNPGVWVIDYKRINER